MLRVNPPIIHLVTDDYNLFDYDYGICGIWAT